MRRAITALSFGALATIAIASGATASGKTTPSRVSVLTTTAANRAIVIDFARMFYTERNVAAAFEKYVAPDYIQHNPDFPDGRGPAIAKLSKLFGSPGARFDVKRIMVDGDLAVIHLEGRPNPAAKGVAVVDIYRLKGGKIVEHWDVVQRVPETSVNPHPMF